MAKVRICILRETRNNPDGRAPLAPFQCKQLLERYGDSLEIYIQPARFRCFSADDYAQAGVRLREEVANIDYLVGIEPVVVSFVLYSRTYMYFARVGRLQVHNRGYLRQLLARRITLIDFEYMRDNEGNELASFGRFTGIVYAYNALRALGIRTGKYELERAYKLGRYEQVKQELKKIVPERIKVLITGKGKSADGVIELLREAGFKEIPPQEFPAYSGKEPVYTLLGEEQIFRHRKRKDFDPQDFRKQPQSYESKIEPYLESADILANCLYWDYRMPSLFTPEWLKEKKGRLQVIADVSCDLKGAIPVNLRTGTIESPIYGYHIDKGIITSPGGEQVVDIISVDNAAGELAADATIDFGEHFMKNVVPALLEGLASPLLQRATIIQRGRLTEPFKYLEEFLRGNT